MNDKLLKIARYLEQNGLIKEADELEKLTDGPKSKATVYMDKLRSDYVGNEDYKYKLVNMQVVFTAAARKDVGTEQMYSSKRYPGWTQEDFIEARDLVNKEIKDVRIKEIKSHIEKLQAELAELEK